MSAKLAGTISIPKGSYLGSGDAVMFIRVDNQSRIEVGYGLEGVIPDGFVGRLQRNVLAPNFELDNYYQGLSSTLDKLAQQISKDFTTQPKTQPQNNVPWFWIVVGAVGGL